MKRIGRGALILVCILLGLLVMSNLDKGVQRFAPDELQLGMGHQQSLDTAVAKVPGASIVDQKTGVVRIPYGETDEYLYKFLNDWTVKKVNQVSVPPSFSLRLFVYHLQEQIKQYAQGNVGMLIYESKDPVKQTSLRVPQKEYSIAPQLPGMIARSFSYLIPALLTGVVVGYLVALLAVWKPRWGRLTDSLHALLLSLPDFFLVALLQLFAILLTKAAGHNVIPIMQFADTVPFLIPFLAISILPGALVYGTVRLAVEREWQEGYIKTAYAKGLGRTSVLVLHILRNTWEDLLSILPRAVSVSITSLVIAEVMTHVFGLGGYVVNDKIIAVTSLPTTCAILAVIALSAHVLLDLLRKRLVVNTKEGV